MRVRGLGILVFRCDGGGATYRAKSPGHVSSGHTAPFNVCTTIDTHNHTADHDTGAGYRDVTRATGNHDNHYHSHYDCSGDPR
jgi:hypothetical protein